MPKQWNDQNELVASLKSCNWGLRGNSKSGKTDWPRLVRVMVGANTFRAFHHTPRKPSEVFREWALEALFGRPGYFRELLSIENGPEYDSWLDNFASDFQGHWQRQMGSGISYGPSRKLPNLLMKGVCGSPEISKATYDRLVWFLHVPLDSYSIQAIRNCIDVGLQEQIGRIPRSAGMGFVKTPQIYTGLQSAIRIVAKKAKVPPIALDIVAWDQAHR